jgi:glycosidase
MVKTINISYQPPIAGEIKVGIAGDFTDWQIVPLENNSGIYQKEFLLQNGIYQYKLIIDGVWTHHPDEKQFTPDPFGGLNSVLIVKDDDLPTSLNEMIYSKNLKLNDTDSFSVPQWVAEGIIYQIFPDRFCNGNPKLNPDFAEWYYKDCKTPPIEQKHLLPNHEYYHFINDWYDISNLKQNPYLPEGKPDWWSFYGGDTQGVRTKLDYLLDLGINIIYFNPLWQAKSNHKYDAADFKKIDPHFGSDEEFKDFVSLCHAKGIRIVLDIALNHTGETFWAFRDCVNKGEQSPYWNWYDWYKWPLPDPLPTDFKPKDYYQCWWGVKDMPDLNYDLLREHPYENSIKDINQAAPNQPLLEYILEAISWWLIDMDIDGFRLDVPDEVPFWFWQLFRNKVKTLKPDAWLVGEIWNHAEQWVTPQYFDSVMNYAHFKDPVLDYFIKESINKTTFLHRIYLGLKAYPKSSCFVMMNLLGSHDTWRIGELAKGKDDALSLAIVFQMTYIGTPHIYYGDEIAMLGTKDPDNRRPFNWKWESDANAKRLRQIYQELISLRKAYPVLQKGDIRFIYHSDLLIFERYLPDATLRIVINNTSEHIPYPKDNNTLSLVYSLNNISDFHNTEIYNIASHSAIILSY